MNKNVYWGILLVLLIACNTDKTHQDKLYIKDKPIDVEIISTREARQSAFDIRKDLEAGKGKLIVYPRERFIHCWSRHLLVNVSCGFIKNDGTICDIGKLEKVEEGITSKAEAMYVLVMKERFFEENKVEIGEKVKLPERLKKINAEELWVLNIKETKVYVELAATDDERSRGLKFRKNMSKDDGMLFLYKKEAHRSFWMKDTHIPLSIAYIKSDGTISSIHPAKPLDESSIKSKEEVQYVLEMNQGWFDENKVKAGDKITFPKSLKDIEVEDY
jgi:hypothetical protein